MVTIPPSSQINSLNWDSKGQSASFDGELTEYGGTVWVRLDVQAGTTYHLFANASAGYANDQAYEVYNPAGELVDQAHLGGAAVSTLAPTATGPLYIALHTYSGDASLIDFGLTLQSATDAYAGSDPYTGNYNERIYGGYAINQITIGDGVSASGGTGDDIITGNSSSNQIWGDAGDDALRTGGGDDVVWGGEGADYISANASGNVELYGGSGTDHIYASSATTALIDGGSGADFLSGSEGADIIRGGADGDYLDGGNGADLLDGGSGNDTYFLGADTSDTVVDASGTDTILSTISRSLASYNTIENLTLVYSSDLNFNGTGNALANIITGNDGNNVLDGGAGLDTLIGGIGNDTFVLGADNDIVSDSAGIDTITSTITRSLLGYTSIEGLKLLGSANINATGNDLDNTLNGNSGANTLDGGAGQDTLAGGLGNDTYVMGAASDTVIDSGGNDTITSTVNRSLVGYTTIDGLKLLGSTNINGTGNDLGNVMNGNSGNNILQGKAGNDTLAGGAGNDTLTGGADHDTFLFNSALNAATNVDKITDFNVTDDRISLENSIFSALTTTGTLSASMFENNATGLASTASSHIIYESDTGWLNYDSNGSAAGGSTHFAKLSTGLALTAGDFTIV